MTELINTLEQIIQNIEKAETLTKVIMCDGYEGRIQCRLHWAKADMKRSIELANEIKRIKGEVTE